MSHIVVELSIKEVIFNNDKREVTELTKIINVESDVNTAIQKAIKMLELNLDKKIIPSCLNPNLQHKWFNGRCEHCAMPQV